MINALAQSIVNNFEANQELKMYGFGHVLRLQALICFFRKSTFGLSSRRCIYILLYCIGICRHVFTHPANNLCTCANLLLNNLSCWRTELDDTVPFGLEKVIPRRTIALTSSETVSAF